MSTAEAVFKLLADRYEKAKQYEKTKYMNDTPEGKSWAEKEIIDIVKDMHRLWNGLTEDERKKYDYLFK
jgi:hypothetical protein